VRQVSSRAHIDCFREKLPVEVTPVPCSGTRCTRCLSGPMVTVFEKNSQ